MAAFSKPIPPLYTVYILRSTIRNASLYIGSTPNPPRRLKQHNGEIKGGAARTSRRTLRPWEMVGLVSGFPGMVAALKFEWALNNPHVSLHIPAASRITAPKYKKRGRPRRPSHSIKSILSNVHLLLRVPSFARWPLKIHFFASEVYAVWTKYCATVSEPLSKVMSVHTDFPPSQLEANEKTSDEPSIPWGINTLPLDYEPMKGYVEKTRSLYSFEREGSCAVCKEVLEPGEGLYATCSNDGCECTGHLSCWSRHLLGRKAKDEILPICGHCPKCKGEVIWGDMMKEMSLRLRGQKEVDDLLLKKRRKRRPLTTVDPDAEAD